MPDISHSVADFINLLYDTKFDTKNLMILSVLSNCLWESGHSVTLNHTHFPRPVVNYLIFQQYCMVHPIWGDSRVLPTIYYIFFGLI